MIHVIMNNKKIPTIIGSKSYIIPDNNNTKRGYVKITGFWEGVDGTLYADMGETIHGLSTVCVEDGVLVMCDDKIVGAYNPISCKVTGVRVVKRHTFDTLTELIQFYKMYNMDKLLYSLISGHSHEPHIFRKYITMYEPDPSRYIIRRKRYA